jgi:gamma-glutamylcyclotransferase (GGCT)/AIG2-like uncharacterized protein YtfP
MLYFAQGSYIDHSHMKVCCPAAAFVATGRLRDYRLCFPRWSRVRDTAVAGIEPAKGETAWGAVYQIAAQDLARLDLVEGYAPGRVPELNTARRLTVRIERTDGLTVEAETHVAVPMAEPGEPSPGYLLVLTRAAEALQFPADFIAKLRAAKTPPLAA